MRKFFSTKVNPSVSASFSPYRTACMKACETVEGAQALAGELSAKIEGLPLESFVAKRALKKHLEVANHAAQYRATEQELLHRIPAASQRDEAAAKVAIKDAEQAIQSAQKQVASAEARVNKFRASADQKRSACDESSGAALNRLHLAEAALQAARDKEDADAMGRAAALVVQARKEVAVVQDRNSVLLLEADSFVELADKARAELQAAVELLKAAQGNRHEAQLLLLAVEADRHALQALLAHARWVEANDRAEVRRIPSRIDAIGFFFHQSERAPQWEGKGLPVAFTGTQLNQFQGLLWALREPAWNEFDTDPSGIPFDAAAAAAGQ